MPPDSVNPHVIHANPTTGLAGQSITFTVTFTGACDGVTSYPVSSSLTSAFSSLPATVTPGSGETSVQFIGIVGTAFSGLVSVSVSGSGGSVQLSMDVIPPAE